MEKLIYLLWRSDDEDIACFGERLRGGVARSLLSAGALGLQLNIPDDHVEPAFGALQVPRTLDCSAMLSVWVRSAFCRGPLEKVLGAETARFEGYLVTGGEPLANTLHPPVPGERTYGYSQVAFLQRPDFLTYEAWLDVWLGSHTQVAIDTQSTFRYLQNVVVFALTDNPPEIDAIVEECFPPEAMTDLMVFYDAFGDEEKFNRNNAAMMESCGRFIDFERIEVLPTSEYLVKPLAIAT